ncbi:MAG: hypothetical protein AAGI25_11780 [Bacteroidota bacterium]
MKITLKTLLISFILLVSCLIACDSDDGDSEGMVDSSTALLYSINTNTPDGYFMYMGAFPDFPSSEPNIADMVELGGGTFATAFNEDVYSFDWDALTVTKWLVSETLEMTQDLTISFANTGIPAFTPFSFYSSTRAFLFDFGNGKVVEWNPTEMTITGTIEIPQPNNSYSSGEFYGPHTFGNRILIPISDVNFETFTLDDATTVAIFDVETNALEYKSDNRMATTSGSFMDSQGRVYLFPTRGTFWVMEYGDNANVANYGKMLRFDIIANEFDQNFEVDINAAVDGTISKLYMLNDNEVAAEVTALPLPEISNPDNYFATAPATLKKINLNTLEVTDYSSVGTNVQSWINNYDLFDLSGNLIYPAGQFPDNDYNSVNTRFYRVNANSAEFLYESTNVWPVSIELIR